MTIWIGALTLTVPSIVLSADTRVTHGGSGPGSNDQAGKQYPLPPYNCVALIAGSVSECHEFVGRLVQQFEALPTEKHLPYREDVMAAINEARWQVHRPKIDQALRAELGITLAEWHDKFLPPAEFDESAEAFGMRTIRNNPLNVSAIVGGFIGENTMFFCARGMKHLQSESSPGVHTIGSGSVPAMHELNKRGQNLSFGLARTVFHVHEAMLASQKEPTVGPPTNYLVAVKDQPLFYVPSDSPLLGQWLSYYQDRDTAPLDTEKPSLAIQAEMRPAKFHGDSGRGRLPPAVIVSLTHPFRKKREKDGASSG